MLEELPFDRVFVEPSDGAQPPGDGGARSPSCFQVAGEAFDVGASDGEQVQGAGCGTKWLKAGWIAASAADGTAVVIGHLPAGLRPGRLSQLRVPAVEQKPNVSRVSQSHHVTIRRKCATSAAGDKFEIPAEYLPS